MPTLQAAGNAMAQPLNPLPVIGGPKVPVQKIEEPIIQEESKGESLEER